MCDFLLKVLDSENSQELKLEKLFASKESIELLSQLCFSSLLRKVENRSKVREIERERETETDKTKSVGVKRGEGEGICENQKIMNSNSLDSNGAAEEEKEKRKEKEKDKEKEKEKDNLIVALPSEVTTATTVTAARLAEDRETRPHSVSSNLNMKINANITSTPYDAHSQRPAVSAVLTTVSDKLKISNEKDENSNMKKKTYVPLLELDGVASPDDEATIQRNGNLSHNSFLIIKKLSILSPHTLFDNFEFLQNLQSMVSACLINCENSNSKRILETNLLSFSNYSIHQRAVVTMEVAYRNSNQLKSLCEIIIQYCRSFPSDSHTKFCNTNRKDLNLNQNENSKVNIMKNKKKNDGDNNNNKNDNNNNNNDNNNNNNDDNNLKENIHTTDMFQKMIFSLLPVLTMKISIIDFTFLSDFFKFEFPLLSCSPTAKKEILRKTFDLVAGKKASVPLKVKVIQVYQFIFIFILLFFILIIHFLLLFFIFIFIFYFYLECFLVLFLI